MSKELELLARRKAVKVLILGGALLDSIKELEEIAGKTTVISKFSSINLDKYLVSLSRDKAFKENYKAIKTYDSDTVIQSEYEVKMIAELFSSLKLSDVENLMKTLTS